ncbi:MAG TPA: efflux RND transporter periplasmic adaptor subunit [Bacillota bacterium]|nr:efflux RND transporter periplasmic adaptor subunit [Bacillota bacterium]
MNKKKKLAIGAAIIVLTGIIVFLNIASSKGWIDPGGRALEVEAQAIARGSFISSIKVDGIVEEIEKKEISFHVPVIIEKVLVERYDYVTAGQQLFQLDLSEYYNQLAQAEREKLIQQKNIEKIDARDYSVSESLKEEVARAKEQLDSAREAFAAADPEDETAYNLARQNLTETEAYYEQALSALEEAKKSSRELKKAATLDREILQQGLKTVEEQITALKAQISDLQNAAFSPLEGYVTEINVKDGDQAGNPALPSAVITNPHALQVNASIREIHYNKVAPGQKVLITGDALEGVIEGRVEQIAPVAAKRITASGEETAIEVIISLPETAALIPGLNVECEIITLEEDDVLVGSYIMLLEDPEGRYVFVIDEEAGVIRKRYIEIGSISMLEFEITGGLAEGEKVVLNPQPYYSDGMKVKIKDRQVEQP